MADYGEVGPLAERRAQGVVEVLVPDLHAAMAWYATVGFSIQRLVSGFAVMALGDVLLFLAEDATAPTIPRGINLRIVVPDLEVAWRRIGGLGLDVVSAPGERGYGLRDFTLRDPFGFELRFAEPID